MKFEKWAQLQIGPELSSLHYYFSCNFRAFCMLQTSTNLLLFANGVQFNSSPKSNVLHTEYITIW